jgi:hypothetical protein
VVRGLVCRCLGVRGDLNCRGRALSAVDKPTPLAISCPPPSVCAGTKAAAILWRSRSTFTRSSLPSVTRPTPRRQRQRQSALLSSTSSTGVRKGVRAALRLASSVPLTPHLGRAHTALTLASLCPCPCTSRSDFSVGLADVFSIDALDPAGRASTRTNVVLDDAGVLCCVWLGVGGRAVLQSLITSVVCARCLQT